MTEKELLEIIELPKENEWAEFKIDDAVSQDIGEYLSALSNSACLHNKETGYLVFGIKNKTHEIVGTKFNPKEEKVGNEELENWLATLLNPRVDFRIIEFDISGKKVVVFEIDSTEDIPVKFRGVDYIRVGSYKKRLSEFPEKARKIWNKSKAKTFEKVLAISNQTADYILKVLDYPSIFELLKFPLPSNKHSIIEKLVQEKLVTQTGHSYGITNLGAILIAKDINEFDELSRKTVRVIMYKGKDRIKTEKEQPGKKGYATGFEGLIDYIGNILPSNEEIIKAIREETKLYPLLAIRELVANALIHQDFSIRGTAPMVEIFDDRIEITNPGKPLISPLRFIDHNPQSRNEKLAHFMRRIGICEERGSGIDKVIFQCELFQLPAPEFIAGENFTRVILYSPKSLREMDKQDKIRACYQHCSLKHVSGSIMTNQTLRERFGIEKGNYPIVSRIISDTLKAEFIKDYDPLNKSRKYAKYLPFWA